MLNWLRVIRSEQFLQRVSIIAQANNNFIIIIIFIALIVVVGMSSVCLCHALALYQNNANSLLMGTEINDRTQNQ